MVRYSEFVGIIGGLGPQASASFYSELIIKGRERIFHCLKKTRSTQEALTKMHSVSHSKWTPSEIESLMQSDSSKKKLSDQDHVPFLLFNASITADRTCYILGRDDEDPFKEMFNASKRLCDAGVTKLAIVCNTAHYFVPRLEEALNAQNYAVPFLQMPELCYEYIKRHFRQLQGRGKDNEVVKVGLLVTEGSLRSKVYSNANGIKAIEPNAKCMKTLMEVIYKTKSGKTNIEDVDVIEMFLQLVWAVKQLRNIGCDAVILGCTELPIILTESNIDYVKKNRFQQKIIVDLMEGLNLTMEDVDTCRGTEAFLIVNSSKVLADEIIKVTLTSKLR